MSISHREPVTLVCPACQQSFQHDVWTIIDAGEQPELTTALLDGTLNQMACPHCAYSHTAQTPLLYHDPALRSVLFAANGASERQVRERAQELTYQLVEQIPEEQRLPYLGDVEVFQELSGMRRAIQRASRRAANRARTSAPATTTPAPAPVPPRAVPLGEQVFAAVQDVLQANTAADLDAAITSHPALRASGADAVLHDLMTAADAQGERDIADAIRSLQQRLQPATATPPVASPTPAPSSPEQIPVLAYQALLRATSSDAVLAVAQSYPALLEPWADSALAHQAEQVLDEGNERLAVAIDERREALSALRNDHTSEQHLLQAVEALLSARDEAVLEDVLARYPILLTDPAQRVLQEVADGAHRRGDRGRAQFAEEYRMLLQTIREGLDQEA